MSKQSYVQAVSYVRRDAVLSGNQRLNFIQMYSVPKVTFSLYFCLQIDSARMSGLNEVLAVYLMAAKQVPGLHHGVSL